MKTLEKNLSEISEEIMRKNRTKMLNSVETYINQEYVEIIERNLKKGELYQTFSEFADALEEMISKFKSHFKLPKEDDNSFQIKTLKTLMFNKVLRAGSVLEQFG